MRTRDEMLAGGKDLVFRFCEWNGLPVPTTTVVSKADWQFPSTCAYYREGRIVICPERCAPIGHAGRAWSYPGYVTDRTPFGVMAHEMGHHVDRERSGSKSAYGGEFSEEMRRASGEPKLTSYCPNDWEWFAEMFRLFATNPKLLKEVRPNTFHLMLKAGLRPVEHKAWQLVLEGAPQRTRDMAARKVADAQAKEARND